MLRTPEVTLFAAPRAFVVLVGDGQAERYEPVLTPPARRALTERLPEQVAAAVIDFVTTTLVTNPRQMGKPLRGELAGVWAARRGTYRVLYRIHEDSREVVVLRVDHRRDVYRPH